MFWKINFIIKGSNRFKMEEQQKVWDEIAKQWFHFRQKPFKDLDKILNNATSWKNGKILDIGCGNCRNLLPFAKAGFQCYGIDFSKEMLKYAKQFADENKFKVQLKQANAENIPFKDTSFNYALSIATLHHLNKGQQIRALQEMLRVLKKGGKAIITVWNKLQPKFIFKKRELMIPWHMQGKVYQRYYYIFNFWELRKLLKNIGFKIIYSGPILGKNIVFIVEK